VLWWHCLIFFALQTSAFLAKSKQTAGLRNGAARLFVLILA